LKFFSRSPVDRDSIDSYDSDDNNLEWGDTNRWRQTAATQGGVQKNPYAGTSKREYHSRNAKAAKAKRETTDLVDTDEDEYDNTALAITPTGTLARKKNVHTKRGAIRIAIGRKVFSKECAIQFYRTTKGAVIELSAEKMKHVINLEDETLLEMKYFVSNDDEDQAGATIAIDFDESEQMTFLAIKVKPNEKNDLTRYPNLYQPENSDCGDDKRYIAIEFRHESEFLDLLKDMKKDESVGGFVFDSSSLLTAAEAEVYGKSLFQAARKERADRESNVCSPRLRRKRKKRRGSASNEVMLVFPFGADKDAIEEAAKDCKEACRIDPVVSDLGTVAFGGAGLESNGKEVTTSAPEETDSTSDDDDDKDDSTGTTKSRAHFLTIREEDYDRLHPGEFLNDTLIDFWFQWYVTLWLIQRKLLNILVRLPFSSAVFVLGYGERNDIMAATSISSPLISTQPLRKVVPRLLLRGLPRRISTYSQRVSFSFLSTLACIGLCVLW
jgi:hypothetical protein